MANFRKRLLKIGVFSLAVCLSAACSAASEPVDGALEPSSSLHHTIASSTPKPSLSPTQEPVQAAPSPSPSELPINSSKTKLYQLNKNYDVVPIDPNDNKKVVLLTFDDGPKDLELNTKLLAALEKHKAKAIFFVNGYRVEQNPELLKLIHSKGQSIGNHSWDHIDLKLEKPEKVAQQINDVQTLVKETIGEAPKFFRPPFGSSTEEVKKLAADQKLLFMTWSNGSEDWLKPYQNPQAVITRVLEQLHFGSNILMHELPWTAEALDDLLTQLEKRGYAFVDPQSIETPE